MCVANTIFASQILYRSIGIAWNLYPLLARHPQWKIIKFEVYKIIKEETTEKMLKE